MVTFAKRPNGFTLIELLVTLAIVALLLSIVTPRYFNGVSRAEEAVLKETLFQLRDAIDKHYADTGRYPGTLDDLVTRKYIRRLPSDPITRTTTSWVVVAPADARDGSIYDVRSGAGGYESW